MPAASQQIMDLQKQLAAARAAAKTSYDPDSLSPWVRMNDKLFVTPNGRSNPGPLNVVILDHRMHNSYFKGAYNPKNPQPPICWANAFTFADLKPADDAPQKQADSCAECPMNKFGSAPTGRGKACKNTFRIAFVPPDANKDTPIYMLSIPPTSVRAYASFVSQLGEQEEIPFDYVTEISMDPNEAYAKLQFQQLDKQDNVSNLLFLRDRAQNLLDQT